MKSESGIMKPDRLKPLQNEVEELSVIL